MIEDEATSLDDLPELSLPYERDLFLWLNNHHSDYWDVFMTLYSSKVLWIPMCVILLFLTFYKTKWQNAVLFILCFVLLATLCDQISSSVVKPFFARLRPTHHPDFMYHVLIVNDYKGGRFGFISSHATNGFGVATFVSLIYKHRNLAITLFLWALASCYSRIYLGVHFISDIIGGIILGSLIGFLIYLLFQYLRVRIFKWKQGEEIIKELQSPVYSKTHANVLITAISLTVLFDAIYSLIVIY